MKIQNIILSIFCCLLFCCKQVENDKNISQWDYKGNIVAQINSRAMVLENEVVKFSWQLKKGTIVLKEVVNGYDGTKIDFENIKLFIVETADGKIRDNRDFILRGKIKEVTLNATDSLPTKALRFKGKEISGDFVSKDGNVVVKWLAQLREGANYIRQNIQITTLKHPIEVTKVTFFDGELLGANYSGSVLGSPIVYRNFFFGMEHPIAHSKALALRTLRSVIEDNQDVSEMINGSGEYVVTIEHGGGSDNFNVTAISLLEDNREIAMDKHVLNGYKGSNLYHLHLEDYDSISRYTLNVDVVNRDKASGTLHIYKKNKDLLNFYVNREDTLKLGKTISEWAVIGVAQSGYMRRAFLNYMERERAKPYKQFLHYNCWWDITNDGASSFTSQQLIERMHAWNRKFIEPFNVNLDAFVFDDGWDDLNKLWYFDPVKFPDGFKKEAELCKKYNSGIGVWMSPFGGYLQNKEIRVKSAKKEGLEVNDKGLSLAGTNYYRRFYERAADMVTNYGVKYFKFDGFGGSNPKYLPDMEAGVRLTKALRQLDSELFINITVGSWPSPFWLLHTDCTWRGSGDLHNAGVGSSTQKMITYRDGTLHNNIVNRAPLYPLNSIMTVGIAYANLGHPSHFVNDNLDDFKAMVYSFFGTGSNLQELYISHDRMKPEFWKVVADAAKWAEANEDVLKDTHWIGGSPINLEIYGFASWGQDKGIVTLRNPSDKNLEYNLDLVKDLELPAHEASMLFEISNVWDKNDIITNNKFKKSKKIILKPFEVKVLQVTK
ncbi:hypothetical protein [Snuella lapsa]|uniref:Alpha-galactosidase n=1 Tax=Snuella lapsa TaxID=870481 RepID=A0ABP6WR38_9FLAO